MLLVFHIAVCECVIFHWIVHFILFAFYGMERTNKRKQNNNNNKKPMKGTAQMKIIVMKTHARIWFGSAAVAATAAAASGHELRRTLIFVYFPSMFIPILSILRHFPWDRAFLCRWWDANRIFVFRCHRKYCAVAIDICRRQFIHGWHETRWIIGNGK